MKKSLKSNRFFLSVVAIALLCGCGYAKAESAQIQRATISVDDRQREYLFYAPAVSCSTARPIVILLHGYGGSAGQLIGLEGKTAPFRRWLDVAEKENVILIAPDGEIGPAGKRGWNDLRGTSTSPLTDDLTFLRALTERAADTHGGDTHRVYVVGISNGGHMALRVAVEGSDFVSGVGVVAAAMPAEIAALHTGKPLSVVFMNGTRDRILPFRGGQMKSARGSVASTQESVQYWVGINECGPDVEVYRYPNVNKRDRSSVTRSVFQDCGSGVRVALFEVRGAGHNTPSISQGYQRPYLMLTGRQNRDIESADEI